MDREAKPGILERRQARPELAPHAAGRHVVHGDDRAVARPGRDGDGEVGAERLVQRIVERGRGRGTASSGSAGAACGRGRAPGAAAVTRIESPPGSVISSKRSL